MSASRAQRRRPRLLAATAAALTVALGLPAISLTSTPAAAATCPCTIWASTATPTNPAEASDHSAVEVGAKFRSDVAGSVTGVRFYKGTGNTGTHVGHLWSSSGTLLATATFTGETTSGWQQVNFSSPVSVTANTTYVASYYAPVGRYAADNAYFAATAVDNAPLHALKDGTDGGNGVYRYGTGGGFPNSTYQSSNYWVDVVYSPAPADTTAPTVTGRAPAAGASGVATNTTVAATFSEAVQPATIALSVTPSGGSALAGTTAYDSATATATFTPNATMATSTSYTVNLSGAKDTAGNTMSPVSWTFTTAATASACPCTIWPQTATPTTASEPDGSAIEVGVKFRASSAGFITGLRFYKGSGNTGTHVGHLWSSGGTLLSSATFGGESTSGWQQVTLPSPVAVTANTTYVASYHTDVGFYAVDNNYFGSSVARGPLTALADGLSGPNGVYGYGASSFPTNSFQASNYWVDVVFDTTASDTTPPTVTAKAPAAGSEGIATATKVTARFSEAVQPSTIGFTLTNPGGSTVAASTAYDSSTQTATLTPSAQLATSTTYTATVSGAKDTAGNTMAPLTWSFTTGAAAPGAPDQGPGGPILVLRSSAAPSSPYLAEMLRAEGFNSFATADVATMSSGQLSAYDVVILDAPTLTSTQVLLLTNWVGTGGNLIALRPDKQLAGLLGLTATTGTLANGYLKVDTASAPGAGITSSTIQYHGTADRYTLNSGTKAVANLYSNSTTATSNPAVSLASFGGVGGQAAAFTYDLAASIVQTRQGNPAWVGQERDGTAPIRSDDLYFGGSATDWVDLSKVAIPQADEQQRLLGNLIESMNTDRKPLPKFWYFPRSAKAVVVATGDDHGNGGTSGRFDTYLANSTAGCVVADWGCLRFTSYIYPNTPLTDAQAKAYANSGFEVGVHPQNGCTNFTAASLESDYSTQLSQWQQSFPSLPSPVTNRYHCLVWSQWATQATTELRHGMRLDTNYYYWPGTWIQDRPGFMTGSGMPMRFADTNGSLIDVYQAATVMTDESGQSYPSTPNTMIDNALGSLGYYGAFVANEHTDSASTFQSDQLLASAMSRGVPMITSKQLLEWTDGRNASSFQSIVRNGNTLTFAVSIGTGANGLTAMLPTVGTGGTTLTGLTKGGASVPFAKTTIKGIEYAMFQAATGAYTATYGTSGAAAVAATGVQALSADATSVTLSAATPATTAVSYGTSPVSLSTTATDPVASTRHRLAFGGLRPETTYYYRLTMTTPAGQKSQWPAGGLPPASFRTPARDVTAPPVTAAKVAPLPDGSADVRWTTSEPADSQVLFGTSPSALTAERHDNGLVSLHDVVLTALRPGHTYWYRVVTKDAAGNTTRSAVASFVTPAFGVADRDAAQFRVGNSRDGGVAVQQDSYGELALAPDAPGTFSTPSLPSGWTAAGSGAGATLGFAGGALALDGAEAGPRQSSGAGRAMDAMVTFSSQSRQRVGFTGTGAAAYFLAENGTLSAVSTLGGQTRRSALPAGLLDAAHHFRVEFARDGVTFTVDGRTVASRGGAFPAMHATARDLRADGATLDVRSLRTSGARRSGTFVSRVLDARQMVTWDRASWWADVPAGTRLRISVRVGSTRRPDATWSAWQPLAGPGSRVVGSSRYLQYQVQLSSSVPGRTPTLHTIGFTNNGTPPVEEGEVGPPSGPTSPNGSRSAR